MFLSNKEHDEVFSPVSIRNFIWDSFFVVSYFADLSLTR